MKKLAFDSSNWKLIGTINDLIDLVNSQQEAIEKLESKVWTAGFIEKYRPALENLAEADDTHRTEKVDPRDMASRNPSPEAKKALETAVQEAQEDINRISTHRTVTLRIPKGMRVGEAITSIPRGVGTSDFYLWLCEAPDTDLQKALDEVQPNE